MRLACVARVQDAKAYVQLRSAWEGLSILAANQLDCKVLGVNSQQVRF